MWNQAKDVKKKVLDLRWSVIIARAMKISNLTTLYQVLILFWYRVKYFVPLLYHLIFTILWEDFLTYIL